MKRVFAPGKGAIGKVLCLRTHREIRWCGSAHSVKEMPSSRPSRDFTESLESMTLTLEKRPTSRRKSRKDMPPSQSCAAGKPAPSAAHDLHAMIEWATSVTHEVCKLQVLRIHNELYHHDASSRSRSSNALNVVKSMTAVTVLLIIAAVGI